MLNSARKFFIYNRLNPIPDSSLQDVQTLALVGFAISLVTPNLARISIASQVPTRLSLHFQRLCLCSSHVASHALPADPAAFVLVVRFRPVAALTRPPRVPP